MKLSILKDSNKAIFSTDSDLQTLRNGTYLRINNDNLFYTICNKAEILYNRDFKTETVKKIVISDDTKSNIGINDEIFISYKEYELLTLMGIMKGGINYKIGDIITVYGGICSLNLENSTIQPTQFKVEEIEGNGSITSVSLLEKGKYVTIPNLKNEIIGGSGSGAELELQYKELEWKTLIRTVDIIAKNFATTSLYINYPLPNGVTEGRISIKKWSVTLTGNYIGESKFDVDFQFCKDFTSELNLPLMAKGSLCPELIYNQAMNILDIRISDLEKRFNKS